MPECPKCGKTLDSVAGLKTHHKLKHNSELEIETGNSEVDQQSVVYFADWNPDCMSSEFLPVTKVGVSSNPERRLNEVSKGTLPPFGYESLEIVALIDSPNDIYDIEKFFHTEFKEEEWHINGEWFNLPDGVIEWVEERSATTLEEIGGTDWSVFNSARHL